MILMMNDIKHEPVLLGEAIVLLDPKPGEVFIDCTVGTGGHAREIAKRLLPDGQLIIIDRDEEALEVAMERLSDLPILVRPFASSYSEALGELLSEGIKADGVLFDLGMSSFQLEEWERGFSYIHTGPLDMRMDRSQSLTAYDVINKYSEDDLAKIFKYYGEERWGRRIAAAICERRKQKQIRDGSQLVELIEAAIPYKSRKGHPAKRIFQAVRIEVNRELDEIRIGLDLVMQALRKGGRLGVISFHSLEDRMVKRFFKGLSECVCPKGIPECVCELKLKLLTPKPVKPSESEVRVNSRAKSAILRVAEVI